MKMFFPVRFQIARMLLGCAKNNHCSKNVTVNNCNLSERLEKRLPRYKQTENL